MELPCVFLRTRTKDCFVYERGYEGVASSELETLLELGRATVRSLESEFETRGLSAKSKESKAFAECTEKLRKSMTNLKILGRLEKKATKLISSAIEILKLEQTTREGKLYQNFLSDIFRQCGREQVLLCAAGLGKQRVVCLTAQDRIGLVHYVKTNKAAFASPILDALVERCQLPNKDGT
jgi:hypothetical protein